MVINPAPMLSSSAFLQKNTASLVGFFERGGEWRLLFFTDKTCVPNVCHIRENSFYLWHCTSLFCAKFISGLL